ncbi:MAG: universal stress protein [Bacteroidia bacterium]|nr:universal stress protein [Bacteroidia bacterium]NNF31430.1 universal stress protein [Flavobacteriaceae bacterium]NNJ80896.1 universal stress protein [Flavobacteriaceae bacterium]NNK54009.1 universal stress protein [Flavobacteriaceae bacterium]NNM07586.1 universal stress protein [Flavobacteriaceae bacterium]
MKNILVPVGSTENGVNNLRYAVSFAAMSGATVYLINIYKEYSKAGGMTKVTQVAMEDNQAQLDEVLSRVDTEGVEVIAKPIKGDPYEGIARVSKRLNIDLIIVSSQSVEIRDEVYLGSITGRLVKQTDIPMLIIPRDYVFRKAENILLAVKSLSFEKENVLNPLRDILALFSAKLNVLRVKTPDVADEEDQLDTELKEIMTTYTETENATIYQGVLEHFQSHQPDILCVLRRKRGFFKKLFEKNAVYKRDFYTTRPLLILCGIQ